MGGATLRRIKQQSGTKIEVMDANGNLNGAHPDPLDPELHVLVVADSQVRHAGDMQYWKTTERECCHLVDAFFFFCPGNMAHIVG